MIRQAGMNDLPGILALYSQDGMDGDCLGIERYGISFLTDI